MKNPSKIISTLAICIQLLCWSSITLAQGGSGVPSFSGIWNPVVGSGADYIMKSAKAKEMHIEMAVVEKADGGAWIEMTMHGTDMPVVRNKMLFRNQAVEKAYMQMGDGGPVMDMTQMIQMSKRSAAGGPSTNLAERGKLIGQESIKTNAGTFVCDHYQTNENGTITDAWVSKKVAPFGLVKVETKGSQKMSMQLDKVIRDAKSKVIGKPQAFQLPPEMFEGLRR